VFCWRVPDDYRVFREIVVDPLEAVGIRVTLTMGNHDRRDAFLEVFPEYAKTTKVPGRIVSVVESTGTRRRTRSAPWDFPRRVTGATLATAPLPPNH